MSDWKGYFIKATKTNTKFPMKYIQAESYSTTPNSREEIKAYRDDNTRDLTRVTASGHKTSLSFKTMPNITLEEKMKIQKFFTSNESDSNQRKINLTYWNDEDNTYKTADFYRADMTFNIQYATSDTIIYDATEISLVEY